jgi:hypothetical protein
LSVRDIGSNELLALPVGGGGSPVSVVHGEIRNDHLSFPTRIPHLGQIFTLR